MRTEVRACLPSSSHKALSVNLGGFHHFNRETEECRLGLKRTWKYTGGGQKKRTSVGAAAVAETELQASGFTVPVPTLDVFLQL